MFVCALNELGLLLLCMHSPCAIVGLVLICFAFSSIFLISFSFFFALIILVCIYFLCNQFRFFSIPAISLNFLSAKNPYFAVATVKDRCWSTDC